jgi:hypothetical protein
LWENRGLLGSRGLSERGMETPVKGVVQLYTDNPGKQEMTIELQRI